MPAFLSETENVLADYVLNGRAREDFVRQKLKEILFDTIGVMVAGSKTDVAVSIGKVVEAQMRGDIPLVSGGGGSLFGATLANSATSYSLDLDAVYEPSTLHVAAILVPLALTLSARYELTLGDVVDALHVGYNVSAAFGDAMTSNEMYSRYFHPTTVAGAFGAAALASRVVCDTQDEILNSLRLVSTMASGLTLVFDEPSHQSAAFQVANAALSGIKAAVLAKEGVKGPPLFYKKSVFHPFSGRSGPVPEGELINKLRLDQAETKTSFKRHSACLFLQSAIDAALEFREKVGIPTRGDHVELIVDPATTHLIDNAGDVTHNAQLVLAIAFKYGRVRFDDYRLATSDGDVLGLKKIISVSNEAVLAGNYPNSLPAILRVVKKTGEVSEVRVDHHRGHYLNPMGLDELRRKFMELVRTEQSGYHSLIESTVFGSERASIAGILQQMRDLVFAKHG